MSQVERRETQMKARGKEGFQQRLEVQGKHPEAEVCVNCRLNQTCASRRHTLTDVPA